MMSLQAKEQIKPEEAIGVYYHVPFCASVCDFCAFYQEKPQRAEILRYLDGMCDELKLADCAEPVKTVFWGGGTPGLLAAKELERLGSDMLAHLNFSWNAGDSKAADKPLEWTVEMAPSTVKKDKIHLLKDLGVTRISMGVQSFDADLLESLGRLHSPKQVYRAYDTLREAGFENVNLDLMFAIPGQTPEAWERDMAEAVRLAPEHISTYCLTFEEDTALWVKLSKGELKRELHNEVDCYRRTWDYLEAAGYGQYEVSNFAKPGYACIHNKDTWAMRSWRGFGPSASSQYKDRRFTNVDDIAEWHAGVAAGKPDYRESSELDASTLAEDALIFGLRMNEGVDLASLAERFASFSWDALESIWQQLVEADYLLREGSLLKLTDQGRMLADQVALQILER